MNIQLIFARVFVLLISISLLPAGLTSQTIDTLKGHTRAGTHTIPWSVLKVGNKVPRHEKIPVILFLHGAGERGTDNQTQLKIAVPTLVKSLLLNKMNSFFIILPQCPAKEKWVNTDWTQESSTMDSVISWPLQGAVQLLDSILKGNPEADAGRVYVTGYSMGGFGTWELLQRFPKRFAAAVPVCGGGDPAFAERMKDVPIWAFHGRKDKLVKVSRTTGMINAIQTKGGIGKMTILENEGHLCWNTVYQNKELITWLISNKLHDK